MKILICAPVNENEQVFRLYLEHLRRLKKPVNYKVDRLFILHNCEHLANHLIEGETAMFHESKTKYIKNENTHFWDIENFSDVVYMKNQLLEIARNKGYDYIFYVDSDLMLHEDTLMDLLTANVDMISNIFWTKWQTNTEELPNCWNFNHYEIDRKQMERWKRVKGYFQVGMAGACTLISRKIIKDKSINWNPIYNVSHSIWEDRAFCIRVACAGHNIHISTRNPAIHLYREEEFKKFLESGGINE